MVGHRVKRAVDGNVPRATSNREVFLTTLAWESGSTKLSISHLLRPTTFTRGSPMIRNPLLEMNQLKAQKQTLNKLCWGADVHGITFSLYIPKWRIPAPWPARIWVDVFPRRAAGDDRPNVTRADIERDGTLRHEPIVATVEMHKVCGNSTIHYRPTGDKQTWEIGEPYVPNSLTGDASQRLRLLVLWDLTSRGMFSGAVAADR